MQQVTFKRSTVQTFACMLRHNLTVDILEGGLGQGLIMPPVQNRSKSDAVASLYPDCVLEQPGSEPNQSH